MYHGMKLHFVRSLHSVKTGIIAFWIRMITESGDVS